MGWFSSKIISVSSSVYNLAGEEENRVDFQKSAILGAVLQGKGSVGEHLTTAYRGGPGSRLKRFAAWARNHDFNTAVGMQTGTLSTGDSLDYDVLLEHIPVNTGTYAELQTVDIDFGDYTYWGLQYILQHHPELMNTAYALDYSKSTNEVKILYADNSIETFTPANFDASARYIYTTFTENVNTGGFTQADNPIFYGSAAAFPSTAGWTAGVVSQVSTPFTLPTTVRTKTYDMSGSLQSDITTSSDTQQSKLVTTRPYTKSYRASSYANKTGIYDINGAWEHKEYWEIQYTTTKTVTHHFPTYAEIETTVASLVPKFHTKLTEYITTVESWDGTQVWIYKQGGGIPALDAMFQANVEVGQFLPIIPFRIDNAPVTNNAALYPKCKKAFFNATGTRYDKAMDKINTNSSIGDLDYIYTVFGVSLNVEEEACKRYLFKFFETLMLNASLTGMSYAEFKSKTEAATASWDAWMAWRSVYVGDDPDPGPAPTILPYPAYTPGSISINSNGAINYHVELNWDFITESSGTGLLKPTAKKNTLWWEIGGNESLLKYFYTLDGEGNDQISNEQFTTDTVTLCWQITTNSWRKLTIQGLKHTNRVWGGKSVTVTAREAIQATEESSFIVPLHEQIYKDMGIRDGTQMATACNFLVFNCYQVYKKKWYQTGWFMIIIIIIIIVITILTWGSGTGPASAGLLGTNAAVGAAMGVAAGTAAAAIAGAIANAIAGMIVSMLIMKAANKFIGGPLGTIIGVIASIVTLQVGTAMSTGVSIGTQFSSLMTAQGLMSLSLAAGNGYTGYLNQSAKSSMAEVQTIQQVAEETLNRIKKQILELSDNNGIDLNVVTSAVIGSFGEPVAAFLTRTLLTGGDISEMSLSMLSEFATMTTSTDLL